MASIDIQALNKHLETIKKKHSDRVNILKVTNAQLHATIAGLRLAEEDSRRLVQTKAVENERLETEQERLRKKISDYEALFEQGDKSAQVENLKLKEQLTQVSADNRKLHSEIQSLKDNMNQLSGNLELKNSEEMKLKTMLTEASSDNKTLRNEVQVLKDNIAELNGKINHEVVEDTQVKSELAQASTENIKLQDVVKSLKTNVQELNQKLEENDVQCKALQNELSIANNNNKLGNEAYAKLQEQAVKQHQEFDSERQKLASSNNTMQKEMFHLKGQLDEYNKVVGALKDEKFHLSKKLQGLEKELESSSQRNDDSISKRIQDMEELVKTFEKNEIRFKADIAESRNRYQQMKQSMENQLAEANRSYSEMEADFLEMVEENGKLSRERNDLGEQVLKLEERHNQDEEVKNASSGILEGQNRSEIQQLNEEVSKLRHLCNAKDASLENEMKKYKSVIGELESVKQKQAEENQKHANDIAAMQAHNIELTSAASNLHNQIGMMKRECEEKERSLESLRKEAQELSLLNQEKKVSNNDDRNQTQKNKYIEIEKFEAHQEDWSIKTSNLHQQISTLQQRISTLEQLEIELKGSNTEKSNAVEQLQHALNEQGSQWQTYVAQLQEQHQNERKQKEDNEQKLEASLEEFQRRALDQDQELTSLHLGKETMVQEIEKLQKANRDLNDYVRKEREKTETIIQEQGIRAKRDFESKAECLKKETQELRSLIDEERNTFQLQLQNYIMQCNQLEKAKSDANTQIEELNYMLSQQKQNLCDEISNLKTANENQQSRFTQELEELQKTCQTQSERIQILTAESNNGKSTLNELQKSIGAEQNNARLLTTQLKELTSKLTEKSQKLQHVESENATYFERVRKLQDELERAGNQVNQMAEEKQEAVSAEIKRIRELNNTIHCKEDALRDAADNISKLKSNVFDLEETVKDEKRKSTRLIEEKTLLTEKVAEIQDRLRKKCSEYDKAVVRFSLEVDQLKSVSNEDLQDAKRESKEQARRSKVLEAQLNKVQENFERKELELSEIMYKEKEKVNEMVSNLVQKTGKLQEILRSKEKEIQLKNEEMQGLRVKFEDEMTLKIKNVTKECREEYSDLILKITKQIDQEKAKSAELQESLKESLRNNEALRSEIEMEPKVKDGSKNENALDIHYPPPPSLSTTGVPSTPESNQIECKIDNTSYAIVTPVQVRNAAQEMKDKVVSLAKKLASETCERMVLDQKISHLNLSHSKSIRRYKEKLEKIKAENEILRKDNDKLMNTSNVSLNDLKDFSDIPGKTEAISPTDGGINHSSNTTKLGDVEESVVYTSKGVVVQKLDLTNSEDFGYSDVYCPDNSGMDISGSMGEENIQMLNSVGENSKGMSISGSLNTSGVATSLTADGGVAPNTVTPPLPGPPPPSPLLQDEEDIYSNLNTVIGAGTDNNVIENQDIQSNNIYDDVIDGQVEDELFDTGKTIASHIGKKSPINKSLVEFEVDWTPKASPRSSRASSRSNSFNGASQIDTNASKPVAKSTESDVDEKLRAAAARVVADVKKKQNLGSVQTPNWFVRNIVTPVAKALVPGLGEGTVATMGGENDFYYNKDLKRWVVRGEEDKVVESKSDAPPPTESFNVGAENLRNDGIEEVQDTPAPTPASSARASFARGRLSSRYVNAFVTSVDDGSNSSPNNTITLSQPPTSSNSMMMNMPPMQSPKAAGATPVNFFMPNSPKNSAAKKNEPAVFIPSNEKALGVVDEFIDEAKETEDRGVDEQRPNEKDTSDSGGITMKKHCYDTVVENQMRIAGDLDGPPKRQDPYYEDTSKNGKATPENHNNDAAIENQSRKTKQVAEVDLNYVDLVPQNGNKSTTVGSKDGVVDVAPTNNDNTKDTLDDAMSSQPSKSPMSKKEMEKVKLLDLSQETKDKIEKNITNWKKKYKKSGNIPKSMKKFCKEHHVSRIAAKLLLRASNLEALLYKPRITSSEEKCGEEQEEIIETKGKCDTELATMSSYASPDMPRTENGGTNNSDNGQGKLPPVENNLSDTVDIHEESEIKTSIDKSTIENDFGEGSEIGKDAAPSYSLQSSKLQSTEKEEQNLQIEKSSKMQENFESNTESNLHAPANVTTVGEENGGPDDRDEIITDLNFEGLEDKHTVDVHIPSVNDLFEQIMQDLQLNETLNVIEDSAVGLERQPQLDSPFALQADELAVSAMKGEELKFSDMSEVDASTIEGMSVYVENVAENMLEMLESNAKEVMKYESEVISEIGGEVEYSRPWWAYENDIPGNDKSNMAIVATNSDNSAPVTLNLVCEKLKLANSQFEGSRLRNTNGADSITATKRFNNIMAITRRATEDFCSGVRTEFRRLVDEITESRAFIQRLEKLLGEEIEQKVNMGIEKSEELKEAERQLRLMEQRERSRMLTLASMKRALKDQMQDVREMLDKRKSSAGGTKPTIAVEDVS